MRTPTVVRSQADSSQTRYLSARRRLDSLSVAFFLALSELSDRDLSMKRCALGGVLAVPRMAGGPMTELAQADFGLPEPAGHRGAAS